jgi:glycerate kinase
VAPHIVIAPDSFKASIDAASAAEAIAGGWREVRPDDELELLPQADGGEGTLLAVERALPRARRHTVRGVTGPDGRAVDADWLLLADGAAVVELAASSGLPLMAALDPLGATTRGLGEVIAAALDAGATRLLVGLGGSASTDGGLGALEALGWPHAPRTAPPRGVTLLTDVRAPLLGPHGAAAVFGPQKGATPSQIAVLEERLAALVPLLGGDPGAPGSGAAGGTAFGLASLWPCAIASGAEHIAALSGLDAALERADVLLTGEGRFDAQSLDGKVVGHQLARARGRTVVIAGQLASPPPDLAFSLSELAGSAAAAIAEPARWLRAAGAAAARELDPTFSASHAL